MAVCGSLGVDVCRPGVELLSDSSPSVEEAQLQCTWYTVWIVTEFLEWLTFRCNHHEYMTDGSRFNSHCQLHDSRLSDVRKCIGSDTPACHNRLRLWIKNARMHDVNISLRNYVQLQSTILSCLTAPRYVGWLGQGKLTLLCHTFSCLWNQMFLRIIFWSLEETSVLSDKSNDSCWKMGDNRNGNYVGMVRVCRFNHRVAVRNKQWLTTYLTHSNSN